MRFARFARADGRLDGQCKRAFHAGSISGIGGLHSESFLHGLRLTTSTAMKFAVNSGSFQRLVIAGCELREEVVFVEREVLRESHCHNLFLRINLAIGRGRAIPAELPER